LRDVLIEIIDKVEIKKEKIIKYESFNKVNVNKTMLTIETLEKIVLILLIFKIKIKRLRRKIKLRAFQVVRKRGAV